MLQLALEAGFATIAMIAVLAGADHLLIRLFGDED